MKKYWGVIVIALGLAGAIITTSPRTEQFTAPLYARERAQTAIIEPPADIVAWLHVEVETNWAWFWQKSQGRAWVTAGQKDTMRINVGKLCLRLAAHDTTQKCEYGASEITLKEKKRGVQIRKRAATVSAWSEFPALDTMTVKMEP